MYVNIPMDVDAYLGKVQWSQLTFKYQVKCLRWLTQEYVKLGSADKAYVQRQLEGTGCMEIIHYGLEQRKQAKL